MIDKAKWIILIMTILYTLTAYWAGVLGWADAIIGSKDATASDTMMAHASTWLPSIAVYGNFVVTLSNAINVRKPRKTCTYRLFEWLHRKWYRGSRICVPYSSVAHGVQQLHQALVQHMPFLVVN